MHAITRAYAACHTCHTCLFLTLLPTPPSFQSSSQLHYSLSVTIPCNSWCCASQCTKSVGGGVGRRACHWAQSLPWGVCQPLWLEYFWVSNSQGDTAGSESSPGQGWYTGDTQHSSLWGTSANTPGHWALGSISGPPRKLRLTAVLGPGSHTIRAGACLDWLRMQLPIPIPSIPTSEMQVINPGLAVGLVINWGSGS